ncbi:MAG: DUF503 domain-containing protein [Armatimonadetes bacterium]|nr:DUF503 domain-containing protein [Armatimonadota bacterium]
MVIGSCTVDLLIPASQSLKDKRQVIKSAVETIRNKSNLSVAEVADQDLWQRAVLGMACVTNDPAFAHRMLAKAVGALEADPRVEVLSWDVEML